MAAAFGMLVRAQQALGVQPCATHVCRIARRAEDLAQEVFLQLHRNLASVESGEHLQFWLRKVTVNRSIDRFAAGKPRFEAFTAGSGRLRGLPKRKTGRPAAAAPTEQPHEASFPAAPRAVSPVALTRKISIQQRLHEILSMSVQLPLRVNLEALTVIIA